MFIKFTNINNKSLCNEDVMLLEKISNGDEDALKELYEMYSNLLYITIFKILKNKAESEDLLQSIFLKIWYKANTYDRTKGNVCSWLIKMTKNSAIDITRSKQFRQNRLISATADEIDMFYNDDEPSGLDSIIVNERSAIINNALKKIPSDQSDVIELSYYGGFTQTEIAAELKIPLGTIKTRMRQAIIKLGKVLNPFT